MDVYQEVISILTEGCLLYILDQTVFLYEVYCNDENKPKLRQNCGLFKTYLFNIQSEPPLTQLD